MKLMYLIANLLPLSRRAGLSIFTLILAISAGYAQDMRMISGVVSDAESGEGLISASIEVLGTTRGTVTDLDGNYEIEATDGETLVFSYTGFEDVQILLQGQSEINVPMSSGQLLDEVVVIGYGEVKREDLTGSIQAVSTKDFNKGVVTSAQQMLAGKVPGVSVTAGGAPGDGAAIRIRGDASLGASSDPLYVVDGVPYDFGGVGGSRNPLNLINPNDIESITVLRDASAAAIYGNRAAGGVIIIKTKTGFIGEGWNVSYSGKISQSSTVGQLDVLQADEYRELVGDIFGTESERYALLGDSKTNWQDEIYQTALGHEHAVGLSGGVGPVPIRASLGYSNLDGVLKTEKFERYTASLNINPRLLDNKLQINVGLKFSHVDNFFASRGAIGAAASFDPTQSVFDPDGNRFGGYTTWLDSDGDVVGLSDANPVALLEQRIDETQSTRLVSSFTADYRMPFLPALRANLNLALDRSNGSGYSFNDTTAAFNPNGFENNFEGENTNSLLEFYLNYKESLGSSLDLDLMTGYSYQRFNQNNSFNNRELATEIRNEDSFEQELVLIGMFARANVTFKENLLLTLSVRRDGTSRFSPENRWGWFPAAAMAYKLFETDRKVFDRLKLRASYGVTGQESIGPYYAYQGLYTSSEVNARYQFGDQFITTLRPDPYDERIKWENAASLNFGVDFGIIKDRIWGTLDVYRSSSTDLLNIVTPAAGSNFGDEINTNVGNLQNRGVELALWLTPIKTAKITWDLALNGAYNQNEVTKLTAVDDPDYIGIRTGGIAGGVGSTIQLFTVGFPVRTYFVQQQKFDEEGNIITGEFEDINNDGVVNGEDFYRFENPAPDVVAGITSNLNIGKFDFSFAGRANFGNYNYNNIKTEGGYLGRINRISGAISNLHRSGVTNNVQEQSEVTFSDHFIERADFFRMDHITAGYTLEDIGVKSLRASLTVQNPFVITKYEGLDPEVFGGIDGNIYPRSRIFVFGIDVNF